MTVLTKNPEQAENSFKQADVFIDRECIEGLLEKAKNTNDDDISAYLDKAERFEGLNHREIASLLVTATPIILNGSFP
jgi:2-iminoacetate synthase